MRTPAENGRATARLLPRARVVELRGNGHDQVDSDATGCIARALSRWVNRERFGTPCAGKSNQVDVIPQPPRKLSEFKASKQVPGRRGSVLLAALETASELRFTAIEAVFAGLEPRGGGLRGGSYAASDAFEGGANASRLRVRARGPAQRPPQARLPARHGRRAGERHDRRPAAHRHAQGCQRRAGRQARRLPAPAGGRGEPRAGGFPQIPRALLDARCAAPASRCADGALSARAAARGMAHVACAHGPRAAPARARERVSASPTANPATASV